MKGILLFLSLFTVLFNNQARGQSIYSKSYGNKENPAVIYIHGGPGSNSTLFEATTAQKLADMELYVIAYDRRGEGRSADPNATFTFEEASNDLIDIYKKYNIAQASIFAHSFGGIVSAYFAERYPEKVKSIILVAALFSQQESYNHILDSAEKIYGKKNDTTMLEKIQETRQMLKNTAEYRASVYSFTDGMFDMPEPTMESIELREIYKNSDFYKNNIRNWNAPAIFYQNEILNNVDTKAILKKLKTDGIKLFGIYGKQDRIFSRKQLNDLREITGRENFTLIDNSSHFLYVDQQRIFLKTFSKYMKKAKYR